MPFPVRPEMWFLAFTALTYASVLGALLGRASRHGRGRGSSPVPVLVRVAVLCWLTAVLFLARDGAFESGGRASAALLALLVIEGAVVAFLCFSTGVGRWCRTLAPALLTALQGFRLGADAFFAWRGTPVSALGASDAWHGLQSNGFALFGTFAAVACVSTAGVGFVMSKSGVARARSRAENLLLVANGVGLAAWGATAFAAFAGATGGVAGGDSVVAGVDVAAAGWWAFPWILLPAFHLPLGVALHVLAFRCLASSLAVRRALVAAGEEPVLRRESSRP